MIEITYIKKKKKVKTKVDNETTAKTIINLIKQNGGKIIQVQTLIKL